MAGGALALSAGGVLHFVTQTLSKSIKMCYFGGCGENFDVFSPIIRETGERFHSNFTYMTKQRIVNSCLVDTQTDTIFKFSPKQYRDTF